MSFAKSFVIIICWLCAFIAAYSIADAADRTEFSLRMPHPITRPVISPEREKQLERLLPEFDRGVRSESADPNAYCLRSVVLSRLGKYDLAISDAREAIRLDPQSSEARLCLGAALAITGEYELAVLELTKAVDLGADQPTNHTMLAMCRINLLDFDGAHRDLDAAIAKGNNDEWHLGTAYKLRALVRLVKGDATSAAMDLDEVVRLHPYASTAYQMRGMFHLLLRQDEKAIADLEHTFRLDNPKTSRYRTFDSLLNADDLRVNEAENPDLARCLCERTEWKNWLALAIYADWLFARGRYGEGAEWLSKSIELAPDDMRDRLCDRQRSHQRRSPFSPPGQ